MMSESVKSQDNITSETEQVVEGTLGANLPVLREPGDTVNMLFDTSCRRFGEYPAVCMAMEEPLSYEEMHRLVLVLAAQLQEDGVRHGHRVALLAENSHRWGIAYLAVVRLGAVGVPILPDLPEADVVGGKAIGMKTIWFNRTGESYPARLQRNFKPDYEIRTLTQLIELLS